MCAEGKAYQEWCAASPMVVGVIFALKKHMEIREAGITEELLVLQNRQRNHAPLLPSTNA